MPGDPPLPSPLGSIMYSPDLLEAWGGERRDEIFRDIFQGYFSVDEGNAFLQIRMVI